MEIEMALALRKIAQMDRAGWPRAAAVAAAAQLVESQGFGADHARRTADEAASLYY